MDKKNVLRNLMPQASKKQKSFRQDDAYDLWLDPDYQKTDTICDLLKPFPAKLMRWHEVSSRANLVKNSNPACAEPVTRTDAAEM